LVLILLQFNCTKTKGNELKELKKPIEEYIHVFLTQQQLDDIGFEHYGEVDFQLMFHGGYGYLLNWKDRMMVKYDGHKPLKKYEAAKGQAPSEMLVPRPQFIYNNENIAVYDIKKKKVLLFDFDLKYIDEVKPQKDYVHIFNTCDMLVAQQRYSSNHVFALLDENFGEKESFGEMYSCKNLPYDVYPPPVMNTAYKVDNRHMAHTAIMYRLKDCELKIYDLDTKVPVLKLNWKQPVNPTQKDHKKRKNLYLSKYFRRHGDYYVLQTQLVKRLFGDKKNCIRIFDLKGALVLKVEFPYMFLVYDDEDNDTKVYFLDADENISYIDVAEIL
jgi:hypothetical protein